MSCRLALCWTGCDRVLRVEPPWSLLPLVWPFSKASPIAFPLLRSMNLRGKEDMLDVSWAVFLRLRMCAVLTPPLLSSPPLVTLTTQRRVVKKLAPNKATSPHHHQVLDVVEWAAEQLPGPDKQVAVIG